VYAARMRSRGWFLLVALLGLASVGHADQVIRLATYALPRGLGNPHSSTSSSDIYTWASIFDGLTRVDENGRVLPALALAWRPTNPLTWRFRLRKDVRFSNGEPFDADAVVATIQYLISDVAAGQSVAREFSSIAGARALNEHLVEISTHRSELVLPAKLAAMRIVAPEQWRRLGPEGFARHPVGTGPFQVEEWASARIALSAFRDSWRPPAVDGLEIFEIPETAARVQGLQSGRLDIGLVLAPDDTDALERTGNAMHVSSGAAVTGMSFVTVRDSPVNDQRVRQALNYAVDKEAIIEVLLRGKTRPAGQPAPHRAHGYDRSIQPYPYDPGKARALLAEAGYSDGFDLIAEVVLSATTAGAAVYSVVAEQLAAVGVRLEVRNIPVAQLITKSVSGNFAGSAFGMEYDLKPTLDAMRPIPMHSCLRLVPWHCDPESMPLIDAAQREFDEQKREALVRAVMRKYHDSAPMLYLFESVYFDGLSSRVRDYSPANRIINFDEIRLIEE
jgi:peptide/nickel transport system substrate-binding protein